MNTLILKKPDGTIERFVGKEFRERMKKLPVSRMTLECMFGGIPLNRPEGGYVIEQSEHLYLTADFLK